jgi:hypothetical protein
MATTLEVISSVNISTGGTASIDFASIPSTYTDLQIIASVRGYSGDFPSPLLRFNGDTGLNYNWKGMYLDTGGGGIGANGAVNQTHIVAGSVNGSSQTTSMYSNFNIYISNYASTSTQKLVNIISADENADTSSNYSYHLGGSWNTTGTAISSIAISVTNGWAVNTMATLYGIKKA